MSTDATSPSTTRSDESFSRQNEVLEVVNENHVAKKNISVIKRLSKGKYPVYLTASKASNKKYVMKVFPCSITNSDEHYNNELRFASLSHPNIINVIHSESNKTVVQNGESTQVSYIVSEYAPYGDLSDFMTNHKEEIDEKLARTYFRQLMEGIEYLHSLGVAHLDLKPQNLLLDADFNLRITDFDLSYVASDDKVLSRGTKCYRGPEFYKSTASPFELELPSASDIYSAGIILFVLQSKGICPHLENRLVKGVNLTELLEKDKKKFWSSHIDFQGKEKDVFGKSFRDLFEKMVKTAPEKRISIKEIKQSKWYNGPVYTPLELYLRMKTIVKC